MIASPSLFRNRQASDAHGSKPQRSKSFRKVLCHAAALSLQPYSAFLMSHTKPDLGGVTPFGTDMYLGTGASALRYALRMSRNVIFIPRRAISDTITLKVASFPTGANVW